MIGQMRYERSGNRIVIWLEGEIDLSNAGPIETEMRNVLEGDEPIVVDLSRASYIDSSGARLLFGVARSLGDRLSLVVPENSPLRRVLTLVGLSKVVPFLPRLPEEAAP